MFILVLILLLKAENHSRRRGRKESRSIEHVGMFRLRGEFERRSPSRSRGLARQYSHYGEAGKVKEYRLRGWNRKAGCFDVERFCTDSGINPWYVGLFKQKRFTQNL